MLSSENMREAARKSLYLRKIRDDSKHEHNTSRRMKKRFLRAGHGRYGAERTL